MGSGTQALGAVAETARPAGRWTVIPWGDKGPPSSCHVSPPKVDARAAELLCFALVAPHGAGIFEVFLANSWINSNFHELVSKRLPLRSGRMVTVVYQLGRQWIDL